MRPLTLSVLAALLAAVLAALTAVSAAAGAPARAASPFDWARPAAERLDRSGAWPGVARAALGREATRGDLQRALAALGRPAPAPADPTAPLSMWAANLAMVRALGLEPERRALSRLATEDGRRLRLPRNFASEVLARELGLLHNYPAHQDGLERARRETIRLADVVGMADRARGLSSWTLARMSRYRDVRLPALSPGRLAVAQAALAQVGQPYVWGGDWPTTRSPWGWQAHGGFDCSGLVWWAFKGSAAPRQMGVGTGLRGRTADQMAWERRSERVPVHALGPGDLVFFGAGGPRAKPGTIGHTGIALGNGWMVHSAGSRAGVSLSHLDAYWPSATAFGRRPVQLG